MSDFASFEARAQKGDQLNVVFFGGSLTWRAEATDPYAEILAEHLDANVPHRGEIIPDLAPGQELRIESLCVAGAPSRAEAFHHF